MFKNTKKLDALFQFILLAIIFLIPILSANFGWGNEQIKVIIFLILTTLAGLVWLLSSFINPQQLNFNKIYKSGGIFLLVLFLTSVIGQNFQSSFWGVSPYFQGWIVYAYLYLFSFLLSLSNLDLKQIALSFLFSSLIVSGISIKEWVEINLFHNLIPTYSGRVVSTFGQPNLYSGYLLFTLPFGFYLWQFYKSSKIKFLIFLSLLISVAGILISQSRTAIILLFPIAFWGLVSLKMSKMSRGVWVFLIVSVLAIFLIFSNFFWQEFFQPLNNQWILANSPEKRIYVWSTMVEIIYKQPILGYGLENLRSAYSSFFQSVNFNINTNPVYLSLKDLIVDRAHSYPLDLLIFSGILGLGSWIYLIYQLLKQNKSKLLLGCLLIYLIWIQFQIQSIVQLLYFWVLVGLISKKLS